MDQKRIPAYNISSVKMSRLKKKVLELLIMFSYQLSFFPKILLFLYNLSIDTWKCNRSPNFKLKLWIKGKNAGGYLPIIFFSPIRKPKAIVSIEKVNCRNNCNSSIVRLKFSNIGHFKFWCLYQFDPFLNNLSWNTWKCNRSPNFQPNLWIKGKHTGGYLTIIFFSQIFFFLYK